jgi:hypothetical protein
MMGMHVCRSAWPVAPAPPLTVPLLRSAGQLGWASVMFRCGLHKRNCGTGNPAFTLNVYTHVVEQARRQAVEQVENDLFSIVLSDGDTPQMAS